MKKLLRTVLVLIVAVVGYLAKTQMGDGDAASGSTTPGGTTTEVAEETARGGDVERPGTLPQDPAPEDRGGDVERPRSLPEAPAPEPEVTPEPETERVDRRGESAIMNAFRAKRSDVQIQFTGKVKFMLPYDDQPPRHQQWVMELSNGHTVKIAHNTDLAPDVPGLGKGDTVTVYGEYEYNEKGGVIHWTHHDPRKRHIGGYIQYKGKKYE